MRCLIAFLLPEPVKTFQLQLADQLVNEFQLEREADRLPPHITLKSPFEVTDLDMVDSFLSHFSVEQSRATFRIGGLGSFNDRVVYSNIHPSTEMNELVKELIAGLSRLAVTVNQVSFFDHRRNFHATLAKGVEVKNKIVAIRRYLEGVYWPVYQLELTELALLIWLEDKRVWQVVKTYPLLAL